MADVLRYLGQAFFFLVFAVLIGAFADWPRYQHFPADEALIKISFSHVSDRKVACRKRSREELMELAPNMRAQMSCPRERLPMTVEMEVDGTLRYRETVPPSGFSDDGPSRVYERIPVKAGTHRIVVRMRDSAREDGFDYVLDTSVDLVPAQVLLVDFREENKRFFAK
jgi:hypothetical protein